MSPQIVLWIVFGVTVVVMLALDLGVFHRRSHEVKLKEALIWSAVWIGIALLFNFGVYLERGPHTALEFLTAYLIEKSLSIDNLFVFLLIFSYFRVPRQYEHKVLFWGIIGALVMRAIFIVLGITLIRTFHWITYFFGAILIVAGIRMAFGKGKEIRPERNLVLRVFRKFVPVTQTFVGGKFFSRETGRAIATPLFITVLVVESTDVVFAVDSIPAVLAITLDPFVVYTSNVFAILGLRALYFALAAIMKLFQHLHYGLSVVLVFIGVKMLIADLYKIPTSISLGVVAAILTVSIITSLLQPKNKVLSPAPEDPSRGGKKPGGETDDKG